MRKRRLKALRARRRFSQARRCAQGSLRMGGGKFGESSVKNSKKKRTRTKYMREEMMGFRPECTDRHTAFLHAPIVMEVPGYRRSAYEILWIRGLQEGRRLSGEPKSLCRDLVAKWGREGSESLNYKLPDESDEDCSPEEIKEAQSITGALLSPGPDRILLWQSRGCVEAPRSGASTMVRWRAGHHVAD